MSPTRWSMPPSCWRGARKSCSTPPSARGSRSPICARRCPKPTRFIEHGRRQEETAARRQEFRRQKAGEAKTGGAKTEGAKTGCPAGGEETRRQEAAGRAQERRGQAPGEQQGKAGRGEDGSAQASGG